MIYFAVCVFLSAFLLFQVEPMMGKYFLPWFGGTPAVWSTVMMFFQVTLTGGYAYAYWLAGRPGRRRERIHLVLLGFSLVLMLAFGVVWKSSITPAANWKPASPDVPIWQICKLLFISAGVPFFLLATNGPLMQAWFNRLFAGPSPYKLYALSNAGSLLALVSYPVLVEPNLTLPWQGRAWSLAYLIYAGLAAYGAVRMIRMRTGAQPAGNSPNGADPGPAVKEEGSPPALKTYLLWVALAATASILLLATTSQITQQVAVIPFLWVLPLTIYLLTFILAFSGERWYGRQIFLVLFLVATLLLGRVLADSAVLGIAGQIGIYSLLLFVACMVCHGELYRLRPPPAYLTSFYLMVSVGGALGGVFITFVAPQVFKGYWELPLGFVLCGLLFLVVTLISKPQALKGWLTIADSMVLLAALGISSMYAYQYIRSDLNGPVYIQRNFFGVVRVKSAGQASLDIWAVRNYPLVKGDNSRYVLVHGATVHGYQFRNDAFRDIPTSYYGETSGGGLAILNHPERGKGMRVGVLGLGVGTLAIYGQPGDIYRFYEINPAVIHLAEGLGGYFSFLSDSRARVEIVPGDARLSLEAELAAGHPQNYAVLAVDVFSGDSIPTHLLDVEAFDLYLKHLAPDGILAIHISNRYLDLVPVVWTLGGHFNLERVLIDDLGDGIATVHSTWILLTRDPVLFDNPNIHSRLKPMDDYAPHLRLWTDEYSNLFQILK